MAARVRYTRGPWRRLNDRLGAPVIVGPSGRRVALVLHEDGSEDAEVEGNAALIEAAPDLYEALVGYVDPEFRPEWGPLGWLQTLVNEVQRILPDYLAQHPDEDADAWWACVTEVRAMLDRLEAALAKARGKG